MNWAFDALKALNAHNRDSIQYKKLTDLVQDGARFGVHKLRRK